MTTPPRRWPRGTWMRLHSAERLRAFVGPELDKKMSQRKLARYIEAEGIEVVHAHHNRAHAVCLLGDPAVEVMTLQRGEPLHIGDCADAPQ